MSTAYDRSHRNRSEVAAIERRRLVPIHDEDLTSREEAAALPGGKRAAAAVALPRRSHLNAIDHDGERVTTHGLAGEREDALDEWHTARQVTAIGEEGRQRLGRLYNDQVRDGELARGSHAIEANWNTLGCIPDQAWRRLRSQRQHHDGSGAEHGDQRRKAGPHGMMLRRCSQAS